VAPASDQVSRFIFEHYVLPARESGRGSVTIPAPQAWRQLNGAYSLDLIRGVLGSMHFRNTYHLTLVQSPGLEEADTYLFLLRK
jgi:hypothetical protein